jgi:hypothetical protein
MELGLNLVWMLLAVVIVGLWLRHAPPERQGRRTQIAALAMLILILFPIISVSDDLQAAQNLAEDNIYLRRGFTGANPHSVFPVVAPLHPAPLAEPTFVLSRIHAFCQLPAPLLNFPALSTIQNRPPPAA